MCVCHSVAVRLAHEVVHLTGRNSFHRRSTIVPKTAENRSKIVPRTGVYAIVVERFCIWHEPRRSQERQGRQGVKTLQYDIIVEQRGTKTG